MKNKLRLKLQALFILMALAYPFMYGKDMFNETLLTEMMTSVAAACMAGVVARVTWRW